MSTKYLARIADDGREQTLKDHLDGAAARCAAFCEPYGAKEHGFFAGLTHDLPKYSPQFQKRLRGGPIVDHSTGGGLVCLERGQVPLAYAVMSHHTGLPDAGSKADDSSKSSFFGRMRKAREKIIPAFYAWKKEIVLPDKIPSLPINANDPLELMFFTRMLFSALVDADRLDTEAFSVGDSLRRPRASIETLSVMLDEYIKKNHWLSPDTLLNKNRSAILEQCIERGEREKPGLFTLTVPTGGGKTGASLAFALRHAKAQGYKRVIYVVPYVNIIEQTGSLFREIFGQQNVLEHHSGIVYDNINDLDGLPRRLEAATENWDMPVIVTTAVQFFESLFSSRASQCRKLHNISDSVVIFDEAQMIPVPYLQPCLFSISQLVKNYRVSAVLCTATQPSVGSIFKKFLPNHSLIELCPSSTYNPKAFRRVSYRMMEKTTLKEVAKQMGSKDQVLCIVNRRDTAEKIYDLLPEEESFCLTTLMYPEHRRRVIAEIKRRLKENLPCRVISTSLIEAGVDLDFPAVFRELAGIDSIIQAAGRCNREGKTDWKESLVAIFRLEETEFSQPTVAVSAAIATLRKYDNLNDNAAIDYYFHELLDMQNLDSKKILSFMESYPMNFRSVSSKFHLIEDKKKTVYIPIGEGKQLVEQIRLGNINRGVFRALGQYGAAVDERRFKQMLETGDIEILTGDIPVLKNERLYSEKTGLTK